MASNIIGTNDSTLTVGPTSKAIQQTLYDSSGNEIQSPKYGVYMAPINVRLTNTANNGGIVFWAMRNGFTRIVTIRCITGQMQFDGTGGVAGSGSPIVDLVAEKFMSGSPTGGTSLLPVGKKRTSYPDSAILDLRQSGAGLTFTNCVPESPPGSVAGSNYIPAFSVAASGIASTIRPRNFECLFLAAHFSVKIGTAPTGQQLTPLRASFNYVYKNAANEAQRFLLRQGEGIALGIVFDQTIGFNAGTVISGFISWDEVLP